MARLLYVFCACWLAAASCFGWTAIVDGTDWQYTNVLQELVQAQYGRVDVAGGTTSELVIVGRDIQGI